MHIGFRYHVASIVAVFFSLVLGMLIGSALFQDDRLVKEQGHLISDLEQRFRATEARTQVLHKNLQESAKREELFTAALDELGTTLVSQRLVGREVFLYSVTDNLDWTRIKQMLGRAGANVHGPYAWKTEEREASIAKTKDYGEPIVVAWIDQPLPEQELRWLKELVAEGWSLAVLSSHNQTLPKLDLADIGIVVDVADTPVGELALVLGLVHSVNGIYGTSSGAVGLLPEFLGKMELDL